MKKYSASTKGFYDDEIHGDAIPSDAVELTDEQYNELMAGQSAGKYIVADDRGFPRLVDEEPISPEEAQRRSNRKNRDYLSSTDWYVVRQAETGTPIPQEILDARAAARLAIVE